MKPRYADLSRARSIAGIPIQVVQTRRSFHLNQPLLSASQPSSLQPRLGLFQGLCLQALLPGEGAPGWGHPGLGRMRLAPLPTRHLLPRRAWILSPDEEGRTSILARRHPGGPGPGGRAGPGGRRRAGAGASVGAGTRGRRTRPSPAPPRPAPPRPARPQSLEMQPRVLRSRPADPATLARFSIRPGRGWEARNGGVQEPGSPPGLWPSAQGPPGGRACEADGEDAGPGAARPWAPAAPTPPGSPTWTASGGRPAVSAAHSARRPGGVPGGSGGGSRGQENLEDPSGRARGRGARPPSSPGSGLAGTQVASSRGRGRLQDRRRVEGVALVSFGLPDLPGPTPPARSRGPGGASLQPAPCPPLNPRDRLGDGARPGVRPRPQSPRGVTVRLRPRSLAGQSAPPLPPVPSA